MTTVAVILARGGSKGLPRKNLLEVAGRPCVWWTIDAARRARRIDRVIVSSDEPEILALAAAMGAEPHRRDAALASDTASVDDAARAAVEGVAFDRAVLLYGNVPVRPAGLIDRAVERLTETGCDSVQSVCGVGKHHPWWTARVRPDGRLEPWEGDRLYGGVFRRQDLPPAFVPDGGVCVVTRRALRRELEGVPPGPHAFQGLDRRGIETEPGEVIDIDNAVDLEVARAVLGRPGTVTGGGVVRIGRREIGPGRAPYVIAEIGVNHDGSLARALELVDAAAAAGADAVKVQHFEADRLLSCASGLAGYQSEAGETDAASMLRRLELSPLELGTIRERAHAAGLDAIATVFSVELAAASAALGWDAFKTASPDLVNRPLMAALSRLGLPLILSTGAADLTEVRRTIGWLGGAADRTVVLQCVSSYPTPVEAAELGGMRAIGGVFCGPVGYSDHTASVETGAVAAALGAVVLEKHLTHDRGAAGPDHASSLEPACFERYASLARWGAAEGRQEALSWLWPGGRFAGADGGLGKRVLGREAEVRRLSRQSLVPVRDLPAGFVLRRGDLTVKRPGTGVPACWLDRVVGSRLATAVRGDAPLPWPAVSITPTGPVSVAPSG